MKRNYQGEITLCFPEESREQYFHQMVETPRSSWARDRSLAASLDKAMAEV